MIDRNDPDIGKKIDLRCLASGLSGRITTFYSIDYKPIPNPWVALHNGTVKDALSLAKWELTIPAYGCGCLKFYAEYKATNPPDSSSEDALWAWGFDLHNAINAKLGKPQITIDEARIIWRRNDGLESTKA